MAERTGLPEPSTLADVEQIIQAFRKNDPEKWKYRIAMYGNIVWERFFEFLVDPGFFRIHAYPGIWLQDSDDGYVYGSLTEETRQALEYLHGWYENGILDQDYMMRTPEKSEN